jgi:hypothetical protein
VTAEVELVRHQLAGADAAVALDVVADVHGKTTSHETTKNTKKDKEPGGLYRRVHSSSLWMLSHFRAGRTGAIGGWPGASTPGASCQGFREKIGAKHPLVGIPPAGLRHPEPPATTPGRRQDQAARNALNDLAARRPHHLGPGIGLLILVLSGMRHWSSARLGHLPVCSNRHRRLIWHLAYLNIWRKPGTMG